MSDHYTGKVAAVVIAKTAEQKQYLIAKRNDNGDWEFPGGKPHKDENLLETAEREIKEELGLKIKAKEKTEEYSYSSGGYSIVPIYAEIMEADFNIKLVDHTEYRWIKPEKIEELDIDLKNEVKCLQAFNLI